MDTWQGYEEEMFKHVTGYMVTEFLGRGKYEKVAFESLQEARNYEFNVKANRPTARVLIYAVCKPQGRIDPINMPLAKGEQ